MAAGSLAAAIAMALGMSACSSAPSPSSSPSSGSGPQVPDGKTIARPGHQHDGPSVADGAPITEKPNPKPVVYQNAPVIQASNLLSFADLAKLGIYYTTNMNATRAYQRWTFTGDGKGALQSDGGFLNSDAPFNGVSYSLEVNGTPTATDYLTVAVFQPTYANLSNFQMILEDSTYQPQPGIGDAAVYQEQLPAGPAGSTSVNYLLHRGDTAVTVTGALTGNGYLGKLTDVLKTVVANLDTQAANPTGPSTIDYQSPVFPASVLHPCPLLTTGMFTIAYSPQPAPFLTENPRTGIGAVQFTNDPKTYNYARMDCTMSTGQDTVDGRKSLELEIRTYLSADGASGDMKDNRQALGGEDTDTRVGDDSYVTTTNAGGVAPGSFVFRKGRFVFQLTGPTSGATTDQANKAFTPVAREILKKVGNQS